MSRLDGTAKRASANILHALLENAAAKTSTERQINTDKPEEAPKETKEALVKKVQKPEVPHKEHIVEGNENDLATFRVYATIGADSTYPNEETLEDLIADCIDAAKTRYNVDVTIKDSGKESFRDEYELLVTGPKEATANYVWDYFDGKNSSSIEEIYDEYLVESSLTEAADTANISTFEIDYAPDGVDLSTEENVVNSVKSWLGDLANEVEVEVLNLNGPGGGWPEVRLTGDKEKIGQFLANDYEENIEDIYDMYLVECNTANLTETDRLAKEKIRQLQDKVAELQAYLDDTPEVPEDERASIQAEIDEMLDEINYYENETFFNESSLTEEYVYNSDFNERTKYLTQEIRDIPKFCKLLIKEYGEEKDPEELEGDYNYEEGGHVIKVGGTTFYTNKDMTDIWSYDDDPYYTMQELISNSEISNFLVQEGILHDEDDYEDEDEDYYYEESSLTEKINKDNAEINKKILNSLRSKRDARANEAELNKHGIKVNYNPSQGTTLTGKNGRVLSDDRKGVYGPSTPGFNNTHRKTDNSYKSWSKDYANRAEEYRLKAKQLKAMERDDIIRKYPNKTTEEALKAHQEEIKRAEEWAKDYEKDASRYAKDAINSTIRGRETRRTGHERDPRSGYNDPIRKDDAPESFNRETGKYEKSGPSTADKVDYLTYLTKKPTGYRTKDEYGNYNVDDGRGKSKNVRDYYRLKDDIERAKDHLDFENKYYGVKSDEDLDREAEEIRAKAEQQIKDKIAANEKNKVSTQEAKNRVDNAEKAREDFMNKKRAERNNK